MTRTGAKDVGFHRVGQRRGERVLMILKFDVEMIKSACAQFMVAFHQKGGEGTLSKRFLATRLVGQDTELHVHIGQLRKSVVVAAERDAAKRKQTFLWLGENMRFQPTNLMQFDSPFGQRRIGNELRELFVVDRLNFRNNEGGGLADLGQQILNLPDAGEVL